MLIKITCSAGSVAFSHLKGLLIGHEVTCTGL
ncbi:hypothetical protein BN8_02840 [Fibrisoma limi BUZ 3]|uniref:Uncharacterized protein n=1 Tax=Fibrisoma limi BUZ 3 TaxID=1185876 RepID=I2GIJ8_9BACT|nr:hypothetical protein BN8_02840 [Fibrisoma limi BUZ 3]